MKKFSIPAILLILLLLSACAAKGGAAEEAPADTDRGRHETGRADRDHADHTAGIVRVSGKGEKITRGRAIQIALAHAGLDEESATGLRVELDRDDAAYEMEFNAGRTKYGYKIDAFTGAVVSYEWDHG